jgi:hypothetical protein
LSQDPRGYGLVIVTEEPHGYGLVIVTEEPRGYGLVQGVVKLMHHEHVTTIKSQSKGIYSETSVADPILCWVKQDFKMYCGKS